MKRFSIIFVVLALCLSLCACNGSSLIRCSDTLFETVAEYRDCVVKRHKGTNVLYVDDGYGVSVLLNADGTPQMWKGD